MKRSLLSVLRKNTKLLNSIIFFTCWSQVHAYANSYYLNKPENVIPIMEVGSNSKGEDIRKETSDSKENQNKAEISNDVSAKKVDDNNKKISNKILVSSPLNNIDHNKSLGLSEKRYYTSDIKEGIIGTSSEHPIDQIYDNVFNILIDEKINSAYQYTLEYDLYGVDTYKEVSKVINDDLAIGGKNVQKNTAWTHQSEPITEKSIKQGKNTVIFTLPYLSGYSYKVKNLRVGISNKKQNIENTANVNYNALSVSKFVSNISNSEKLSLGSAELNITRGTLKSSENFSITALRDIDMPALTPEMVNVTSENSGYRFLPHGEHFSAPAKVSLGYDKSKIPSGYTEQDIKTFYFDKTEKKWIALDKDSVNLQQKVLVSKTTHFTDMVNGVLKVPESPETGSYAPNSIKDIKAANPSEGIVSIAPPSPNSMGSVTTSFPIKLPAGRAGMQPSLGVSYSSEGGNGWMGLGWDMSVPSIGIDTRWGVPRYDNTTETELYTIGGEQLTFEVSSGVFAMPNRNEGFDKGRQTDRRFYPRIEGSYNKIIRKGTNPKDYVWIVTSKDGTKSYFGGDESGINDNTVLKDINGNIGHWVLYKTVDTNGNYVLYTYDKSTYTGNPGNGGQELHISEINYTLHNTQSTAKKYKVLFTTTSGREDVQINGRLGFLQIESKRLTKVEVKYGDENVRSYEFGYKNDNKTFKKSLLKNITEKDALGAIFYTNEIEYNEAPDDANMFGASQNWKAPDPASFSGLTQAIQGGYSLLNGSYSSNIGGHFRIGVGASNPLDYSPFSDTSIMSFNKGTFGAHFGFDKGFGETKITSIDIDGDNLPDRIYEQNDGIYFSKNLSTATNGSQNFGAKIKILTLSNLGKTISNTWNIGVDGNFGSADLGFDYSNNTNITKSYFMDFNNDGLIDFVKDGKVLFNRMVSGVPTFDEDSAGTPYPINIVASSVQNSTSLFDAQDTAEKKMMLKQNPLHDMVMVWVAPKAGTVLVKNNFKLLASQYSNPYYDASLPISATNQQYLSCPYGEDCSKADGVAVSFQYKTNDPLVKNINAGDYSAYSFADQAINIDKGEKLYFRVTSKYDGLQDQVSWNPEVVYSTSETPAVDSDNKNLSTYKSQEDFVNSNGGSYVVGNTGTLNLYLNKAIPLSDDAKIILTINDVATTFSMPSTATYNNEVIGTSVNLNANDNVSVKVYTDTQIDWTNFKLIPIYTETATGKKTNLQVEYSMFNDRGNSSTYTITTGDIGKNIYARINNFPASNFNYEGSVTASLKFVNQKLSKTTISRKNVNNTYTNTIVSGSPYLINSNDVGKIIYIENTINSTRDFSMALPSVTTDLMAISGNYINNPGTSFFQSFVNKTGDLYVGAPTNNIVTLNLTDVLSPDPGSPSNATAELNIYDNQGNLYTTLFTNSAQTAASTPITQGFYTYELTLSNGARGRVGINNISSAQTIATVTPVAHKPIFTPQTLTTALNSNQYDNRFGLLYRGWGGFTVNGNNYTSGHDEVVEGYDQNKNYANSGSVTEMKIDEAKLKLSMVYSTNPGTNPTINNPVDGNGGIDLSQLDNNNASLSSQDNYFFQLISDINNEDVGRLTGTDQFIYLSKNRINSSRIGNHSIDTNFNSNSLSQVVGGKLNAPELKSKNQSVSGRIGASISGFGFGTSKSLFNEDKVLRTLIDFNGDGFPDDYAKTNVQLSNTLGFLSSKPYDKKEVGSQGISKVDFQGISAGYSFKHADSNLGLYLPILNKFVVDTREGKRIGGLSVNLDIKNNQYAKQVFIDINGDGLPDKFTGGDYDDSTGQGTIELNIGDSSSQPLVNNTTEWALNEVSTGNSFSIGASAGISLFKGSFEAGLNGSTNTSNIKNELIDINGDGLTDKVLYTGGIANIVFNKGNGFSNAVSANINAKSEFQTLSLGGSASVTFPIPLFGVKITIGGGASVGESSSKTKSTFKDMNGDGYPDFVTSDDADNISVHLNQIGTTNLLKKVTTPMGGSWEVAYERIGNTYDMPQSKYVLKNVITNDGFTGDNAFSPDVSKVTVNYEEPYYSRRERTFYGFKQLTVNQIDTKQGGASSNIVFRKTIQRFNNDNYYLKGALLTERLVDANDKSWTTKVSNYSLRKIQSTNDAFLYKVKEDEKTYENYACFVALDNTNSHFTEGDTGWKTTNTKIKEYDQWGNATKVEDSGDPDIGVSEILNSTVSYTLVNASAYIVMPTSVKNIANGVTREKKAEYNANGDLSKMTILKQGANYSVYDFEYDIYGNISKSTGPANYANQRFFHQYTYDDNVKTYPVKAQDAFGYSSKTQYDFRFGIPTYTEDMNLQPMKYAYDAKARPTEITGPYELFNNIPWTIKFEYNPITNAPLNATNAQSFAVTKHYDPEYANSTINTITVADGFGGAIQVKKTGDIHNQGLKYIVAGKVEEDAFGRALKTYYPTVEDISSTNTQYNAAIDNIEPTINQYDVMDRVVYTKLPGENLFSTITYGFGTDVQGRNMFETIFKDELGSIKKTYTDIKGRTTSVHEVSNTGDIKTQFTHDAIGEILQAKDVNGNITTSVYDDLGRRTSYTHPDSGVTTYNYDQASNMTSKTNAANEIVEYKYDYSRIKEVKYPVYPENNVKYYYGNALDASAMDNNAVGRLWYQTDATGTQYLKYGRLGELTYQRRSVAVPGAQVYWFGTEWQYDTWNRVKTITYPDGEKLTYKYDKAGNLNNVASVKDGNSYPMINLIGYDKFEQRVYLKNGNDTETTYEYETNRRRLLKMYAKNANRSFMQNTYQYDVVSNVMQIHNNAPVVNGLLGGGTNYAFGYDDLYRLTSASGNWRGINTQAEEERHRYTVAMSYDNMHNIMSKTQKHEWTTGATNNNWTAMEPTSYRLNYKYENPSHPHAPTTIVDEPNIVPSSTCCNPDDPGVKFQHYKYDAKGNPLTIEQETCTFNEQKTVYQWDEENRLRFVDTNPSTPEVDGAAIYTYDAGGERIIKDVLYSGILFRTRGEQSGTWPQPIVTSHSATIYPNGLLTMNFSFDSLGSVSIPRYTKHYYAGSQRIVTKNGTSENIGVFNCDWLIIPFAGSTPPINPVTLSNTILQMSTQKSLAVMQQNNITPPPNYGQNAGYNGNCVNNYAGGKEKEIYWFHSDHLGSSSYISGADGEVTQNIEYFPSGEVFVENHNAKSNNSPYKFNGKELDAETGYIYYGARYYNPRVSHWLNVDPLAEQFAGRSPYEYTFSNPIRFTDPTGMAPEQEFPNSYKGKLGQGDWRSSDRVAKTDVWKNANKYNLQQGKGSLEYKTIRERTDFYYWFQTETESRGYETKWAGAAYIIANQMVDTENPMVNWIMSSEIKQFAQDGNKAIFDNVFPRLTELYNGQELKGAAAKSWDVVTLTREQRDVVGPIYKRQSENTLSTLSKMAKGEGIFYLGGPESLRFDAKGDITDWKQRFKHGMEKAVPAWKKHLENNTTGLPKMRP